MNARGTGRREFFFQRAANFLSTGFYIGCLPRKITPFKKNTGAGFLGSAMALALLPLVPESGPAFIVFYVLLIAISLWAISRTNAFFKTKDDPRIVLDEMAGYWAATAFLHRDWQTMVLAFIFFRAFDTLKPWPIKQLENKIKGAFGIITDDIIAGAEANAAVRLLTIIL